MSNDKEHPHIGNNIRQLRELRNYTQEYMAGKLDISITQYGKLEHEEDINTKYLYRIAEVLETNIAKILNFNSGQYFSELFISGAMKPEE
jgi:transcriptional regulator with XRE-family HTH domain